MMRWLIGIAVILAALFVVKSCQVEALDSLCGTRQPTGACGPGLANQDLSGVCRCLGRLTPGALEAVNGVPVVHGLKIRRVK
jgi:hypothetical protein